MDRFPTTRLSLILAAAGGSETESREALSTLCRSYYHPLFAYVRRQGHSADEARDLTQGFIARLLEKNTLREFQRERGRFRSFLLASLKYFLANERDSARALKRGGGLSPLPLDAAGVEPRDDLTPAKIFEKQWAVAVLNRVMEQLREECVLAGKGEQFDRLKSYLTGDDSRLRYRQIAGELGMTEGAVKVAIHRWRQRFHNALRREISMTVVHPDDIGDEIRYLVAVIRA